MKISPLKWIIKETQCLLDGSSVESILVYTGPHYDYKMLKIFSVGLELSQTHIYLGIGSGTHAGQTDRIMIELDNVLFLEKPGLATWRPGKNPRSDNARTNRHVAQGERSLRNWSTQCESQ